MEQHKHHHLYLLLVATFLVVVLLFFVNMRASGAKTFCASTSDRIDCFSCSKVCDGRCDNSICSGIDPDCLNDGSPLASCTNARCRDGEFKGSCLDHNTMLIDKRQIDCCTGSFCAEEGQTVICRDPDDDKRVCDNFFDPPYNFRWKDFGGTSDCCRDDPVAKEQLCHHKI
ncbi:MAG: hypothetical protein KJ709_09560 [Nanoarchaeota archaeon]|nr:hypothetical protein [Nanoarchaeota archaeon]